MKVCGFTIIRNAIKYDYPVIEAITSILPLCDKFIVLAGQSDDGTLALIQSIDSPKIELHHSVWDDTLRDGGRVLAEETNKAMDHIPTDFDWAFYIQSDEVVHEQYHDHIRRAMAHYSADLQTEGLLFQYFHFYASYDYVGTSRKWYRHEIRIVRNDKNIRSYKDAQGFRKNNRKLRVAKIEAAIYHYGWVKDPYFQARKHHDFNKLWHDDNYVRQMAASALYDYNDIDQLDVFKGSHPVVMSGRIEAKNWQFSSDKIYRKLSLKDKILGWYEKVTGRRLFEYRNYIITSTFKS